MRMVRDMRAAEYEESCYFARPDPIVAYDPIVASSLLALPEATTSFQEKFFFHVVVQLLAIEFPDQPVSTDPRFKSPSVVACICRKRKLQPIARDSTWHELRNARLTLGRLEKRMATLR